MIKEILNFLGILSIPSIIWNIYLYSQNRKFQKLGSLKELKKKEIEFEEMLARHFEEYDDWREKCEGKHVYRGKVIGCNPTKEDENKLSKIEERHKHEAGKIFAEIEYLRKTSGQPSLSISDISFWEKLKNNFAKAYRRLRGV